MKEELGCTSVNHVLIKMLVHSQDLFSDDGLKNMANKTNLSIVNNNNNRKTNNYNKNVSNNNTTINHDGNPNPPNPPKTNHFPLLKLPKDIICKIGLILNVKDLLCFDSCNRTLYKMVNNESFLKKCRNFKKFRISDAMMDEKRDCYKFMFANELIFDFICDGYCGPQFEDHMATVRLHDIRNKLKYLIYNCQSGWLIRTLFKSIEKLVVDDSGALLIDLLPLDTLFDKDKSQLKQLEINGRSAENVENTFIY